MCNHRVPTDSSTEIRLSAQLRARLMGTGLVCLGVLVFVATIVVSLFRMPLGVITGLVIFVVVAVFVFGWLLTRRWYVVRLDETGYRVRFVRGAGQRQGRWSDVEDLTTATVAGARCVVLRLRNGSSTTIPVDVLATSPEEFVAALQEHLDSGHGYRRLT